MPTRTLSTHFFSDTRLLNSPRSVHLTALRQIPTARAATRVGPTAPGAPAVNCWTNRGIVYHDRRVGLQFVHDIYTTIRVARHPIGDPNGFSRTQCAIGTDIQGSQVMGVACREGVEVRTRVSRQTGDGTLDQQSLGRASILTIFTIQYPISCFGPRNAIECIGVTDKHARRARRLSSLGRFWVL